MTDQISAWDIGWGRLAAGSGAAFLILLAFFAGRDDAATARTGEPTPAIVRQATPAPTQPLPQDEPPFRGRRGGPPPGFDQGGPPDAAPPAPGNGVQS